MRNITIGHFRVRLSLHFKASLSAKSLLWKSVFIHIEIGTSYHNNSFALRLALKERLRRTRKWPILYKQIPFKGFFSTAVRWNCVPRFEWSIRSLEPHLIMAPPLLSNPLFYMTVLRLASFVAMLFAPRSLHERSLFSFSWLRQYWKWIIWVWTLPWGLSRRRQIMHWY